MKKCLIIILFIIMIVACSKSSNDTRNQSDQLLENNYLTIFDTNNYDLMVSFRYSKNDHSNIWISPTGSLPISNFSLKINNENISLNRFADNFDGKYNFAEGRNYNIEINLNNTIYKTRLEMPYKVAITDFTQIFERTQEFTLNWESQRNNQIQRILLQGYSQSHEVKYPRYLDTKARAFAFEANTTSIEDQITSAIIENINYSIEDKILFYALVESYLDINSKTIYNE